MTNSNRIALNAQLINKDVEPEVFKSSVDATLTEQDTSVKKTKTKQAELYLEAKRKIAELEKENAELKKVGREPIFKTTVKLALAMLNDQIGKLDKAGANCDKSPYNTSFPEDCHATWAMRLAEEKLKQMLSKPYEEFSGLDVDLASLGGVIACAQTMLSAEDTLYWRYLDSLVKSIDVLYEMCDVTDVHGEFFLAGAQNV